MSYEIVVKNWWKENPNYPDGLEPDGYGDPSILKRDVKTESQAQKICKEYNRTHEPGRLSRKAEYRDDGRSTKYQGYTNYATWNVNLWMNNEYAWYTEKTIFLKHRTKKVKARDAKRLFNTITGGVTSDLDHDDMKHVDWKEIARHWETERQELQS